MKEEMPAGVCLQHEPAFRSGCCGKWKNAGIINCILDIIQLTAVKKNIK